MRIVDPAFALRDGAMPMHVPASRVRFIAGSLHEQRLRLILTIDDKAFSRFLTLHKRDLQRISRHTRGEETLESVQSEAWMTMHDLARKGDAIDLESPAHRAKVIAHVYQKLVRYTEVHIRHAVRLDHAIGSDDEGAAHPLMNRLAADEHYDPVVALARREEESRASPEDLLNPNRSLASAYLDLLGRFRHQMSHVAGHLMI